MVLIDRTVDEWIPAIGLFKSHRRRRCRRACLVGALIAILTRLYVLEGLYMVRGVRVYRQMLRSCVEKRPTSQGVQWRQRNFIHVIPAVIGFKLGLGELGSDCPGALRTNVAIRGCKSNRVPRYEVIRRSQIPGTCGSFKGVCAEYE